ncbi:MAG: hypothetical protein KKE44_00970 [Proteobacteria bacterium]|nr:hypothetical protein [Pseudomonadota bacterium]MBU1581298.1 hypothetical protein [Pseudomonadota bacterium]MBU2627052.1 hypothetical protein [Pseudomonadota bacterium]
MSISNNGISKDNDFLFEAKRKSLSFETSTSLNADFDGLAKEDSLLKIGSTLKQAACYFFRYFEMDDVAATNEKTKFFLRSKVDADEINSKNFEFKVFFNIGYDDDTFLTMNAIKLKSLWHHTYFNAVYHYEKNEFEIGLSNAFINKYLLNGMKLEFQANPSAGSGAVLLTKSF